MSGGVIEEEIRAAKKMIAAVDIPEMPEALTQFQTEMRSDSPDMERLAEIISTDITLSGMVLQLVNSAKYGLPSKISSIQRAVVVLGLSTMRNVILSAALRNTFAPGSEFQELFWDQANACAKAAEAMAHSIEGVSPDDAFAIGLFHDAGAQVCERSHPRYPEVFRHAHSAIDTILGVDRKMFKTTHIVISHQLAKNWNLPDHVCQAILLSHVVGCDEDVDDPAVRALTAIIKASNYVVGTVLYPEIAPKQEGEQAFSGSLEELMVDESLIEEIRYDVQRFLSV